jgi:Uncharacterized conserved protein (DUF2190)
MTDKIAAVIDSFDEEGREPANYMVAPPPPRPVLRSSWRSPGVFELAKATGAAINAGASVWWSTADKNIKNASATGLWPIGVAVRAAGTSDTSCRVRLNGVAMAAA